jgi:hypothetical protein
VTERQIHCLKLLRPQGDGSANFARILQRVLQVVLGLEAGSSKMTKLQIARPPFAMMGAEMPRPHRQGLFWMALGYGLMVLGTIGASLLIRNYGEILVAPPATIGEKLTGATAKTPVPCCVSSWRSQRSSSSGKSSPSSLPIRASLL